MTSLRLSLLGEFHVRDAAGREIDIAGNKPGLLLAYLALRPGEAQTRDRIVDLLWPDRGENQARGSLRQALWALRRALRSVEPSPLIIDGETISLDPDAVETDVIIFERLLADGSPESLDAAVSMYKGRLLGQFRTPESRIETVLRDEGERLHSLTVEACSKLLKHRLRNGPDEAAARTAECLTRTSRST